MELIPEGSYFDDLNNQGLSDRERDFFEIIAHVFNTIEFTNLELVKALDSNTPNVSEVAMSRVWSLIDSYYRLYKLLTKAPRIKKKAPFVQKFVRKLADVEAIRNFHQHIDNETDTLYNNNLPVLGHISWAKILDEGKRIQIHVMIPCSLKDDMLTTGVNPLGLVARNKIDFITYFINDLSINLADLAYASFDFIRELEKFLAEGDE
ncbi:hypothetical protein [Tunicatimonas pelagia]|uniref:hypothetical protein n=1 Tax=Tunicatimonas pelagia TaxID=931531 RepID=UPI0026671636|nr:hypothetical protein [Tunicatimonas pelagia]WKN46425.1 hypothetical protein P0M28_30715 [Tunicatimonas pelagia]